MKRTNWTKRATVALAAVCVALAGMSAFAPAKAQDWLLQVEGVPISREVYSYFLSEALGETQRKPDGRPADMAALRRDVAARCTRFVAVNSELRAMQVPVDQVLKAQVAERMMFRWYLFGNYYQSIGVSKQTLNDIITGEAARDQLFRALYDLDGTQPTTREALEANFYGNYVAYQGVRVFRTVLQEDGPEREMTPEESAALRHTLELFVDAVNNAGDFYGVAQEERFAEALGYAMPSITVVRKGAGDMADADVELIRRLGTEQFELLEMPGLFLIAKGVNMRDAPEEYYQGYRADCLWALKGAEYEAALTALCEKFRADENVSEVEKLYKGWNW